MNMENRSISRKKGHRHQLCLYGADEKRLRLAALEIQVSVSALIRLALKLYLPRLIRSFTRVNINKLLRSRAVKFVLRIVAEQEWQNRFLVKQVTIFHSG